MTTLTTQQQAIVHATLNSTRSIVVTARAGCGKTFTALHCIHEYSAKNPNNKILFVSFAKKIIEEAKEKLNTLPVDVLTYNSIGNRLIYSARLSTKLDNIRKMNITKAVLRGEIPKELFTLISNLHTSIRTIDPWINTTDDVLEYAFKYDFINQRFPVIDDKGNSYSLQWLAETTLKAVLWAKRNYKEYDFADQIFLPNVLSLGKPKYDLIVIDECQDTSKACLKMALSCLKRNGRVLAIGDDKQALYSWRGADSNALSNLQNDLNAEEYGLTVTFRCPQEIVDMVINHVPDYKSACTTQAIIDTIMLDKIYEIAKPGSFILSRTNAPLIRPCLALLKQGKPARILGKDIGRNLQNKILAISKGTSAISEVCKKISEDSETQKEQLSWLKNKDEESYDKKCELIDDECSFILSLFEGTTTINEVIQRLETLFTDDEKGFIVLSSVHKIKGLESEQVFLLKDTFRSNSEEERNIDYVAKTRSKKELYFIPGVK